MGDLKKKVVIVGAGPAGLTAAYELLTRAGDRFDVTVLEGENCVGGISRTINVRGNRIDIGGHRFFSKSDWVMNWWAHMLPIRHDKSEDLEIFYQGNSRTVPVASSEDDDGNVFLVRDRLSRIYFAGKLFAYPLRANLDTARKLGLIRCILFGWSYAIAQVIPRRPERSLEDFLINRFGRRLYAQFFRDYTEKVWGRSCSEISAEWGAQRIKGLSIASALRHAIRKLSGSKESIEHTSLIERFFYPRLGPGQLWEAVAAKVESLGGRLHMRARVDRVELQDHKVSCVIARMLTDSTESRHDADFVISTMPVRDLVLAFSPPAPECVRDVASRLEYRDFITVGLLLSDILLKDPQQPDAPLRDNWIYIQEPGVFVGRLQIFNNWSPDLVASAETIWIGMEYFCTENDEMWQRSDQEIKNLACSEIEKLGIGRVDAVLDAEVIRIKKAYPGYFGAYDKFPLVREHIDRIDNLFLVGRNGMHRYNNQDHSMLTAKLAADMIIDEQNDKSAIWSINIDDEYHEQK